MAEKDAIILNEESEIRKSELLIFAQTTPGNLPVPAQRLFLALLANIEPEDLEEDTFIINGKDIANLAKLPANVVGQQLQEMSVSADKLRQYTLAIKESDGNILRVGLISSTKYLKGQRAIRVGVDKALMPYLRDMKKKFAISYPAGGPMQFKSEYSICLYDMMNYYLEEGGHYFTLEETRKMFNIPENKVTRTATLNQRVITPAINDINTYTNLVISVEYKKIARVIVGYYFSVSMKKDANLAILQEKELEEKENATFIQELISYPYNFNRITLFKLIDKYGIPSIKNNFNYTKNHKHKNFARYLYWAITNQIFEKEEERRQILSINKYKDIIPLPIYNENQEEKNEPEKLVVSSKTETERAQFEAEMKVTNPTLYRLMMKVKNQ